jgi:hypothetical protein
MRRRSVPRREGFRVRKKAELVLSRRTANPAPAGSQGAPVAGSRTCCSTRPLYRESGGEAAGWVALEVVLRSTSAIDWVRTCGAASKTSVTCAVGTTRVWPGVIGVSGAKAHVHGERMTGIEPA